MGREYEKEGGGRGPKEVPKRPKEAPRRPPGGPQQAPKRPRDDVTARAPDVHPAKREESTSGSDVLSGSVFCGGDNATYPMYPMIAYLPHIALCYIIMYPPLTPPGSCATGPDQSDRPSFWGPKPTKTYEKSTNSASWASGDSKRASRWPKMAPRRLQDGPRWSQGGP